MGIQSIYNAALYNNYNNANYGFSNNSSSFYGSSSIFQGQSNFMAPQQNSSSNFMQQLVMMLLQNLLGSGSPRAGRRPVEVEEETIDVSASSGGDPHFYVGEARKGGAKLAYDFQGENNGTYNLLDNNDVSVNARFIDGNSAEAAKLGVSGADVARVMGDMSVNIKGSGINVVGHNDGKFEVFENGKKIADQTNYKDIEDKLKAKDITIEPSKTNEGMVSIKHGNRTIDLSRSHGGMWLAANRMKGDKGLNEQAYGALDADRDGETKAIVDVNKDGKVDDKDIIKYNAKNQFMVDGFGSAAKLTEEQEKALKEDISKGIKMGAVTKGYSKDHGYSAMQWNEYVGARVFATNDKFLTAA